MARPSLMVLSLVVAAVLLSCVLHVADGAWPRPAPVVSPLLVGAASSSPRGPVPSTPVPIVGPYAPPDCSAGVLSTFPVCNASLPESVRVADYVSRLTVLEKVTSLADHWNGVARVDLPYFLLVNEGLHGVVFGGAAPGQPCSNGTQFPQSILSSASFDRALIHRMASAISTEQRALNNVGYSSLGILSPQINLVRDPRWGRGQETPGEDPYHISQFAIAFTRGLQEGDDARYLKVMSVGKHYLAYDYEGQGAGHDRFSFNANISMQDLVESQLPMWQAAIETAGMAGVMCSYTSINGEPACAADDWINGLARGRWGMPGPVISDCGAIEFLSNDTQGNGHHFVNSTDDTMRVAMRGGCDVPCGQYYATNGAQALKDGAINTTDVDIAFTRVMAMMMRLGWFDDPFQQPYKYYNCSVVSSAAHQQLAYDVAAASLVLLKNDHHTPLSLSSIKSIAIIGPNSASILAYLGNYVGTPPYLHTVVDGFKRYPSLQVVNVTTAITGDSDDPAVLKAALDAARQADYTVFVGGLDTWREGEGNDRHNISLPQCQSTLITLLEQASRRPLIAVIVSGSSLDLTYLRDSPRTSSLLWVGYSGQDGGHAIADLLLGVVSPAGRLPITFYPDHYTQQVAFEDMSMRPTHTNPGRTYKFYTGISVYPFGYGLSYTSFDYAWSDVSVVEGGEVSIDEVMTAAALPAQSGSVMTIEVVQYHVTVTNTGNVTSDVSVLAFVSSTPSQHTPLSTSTTTSTPLSSSASSSTLPSTSGAPSISPPLSQLFDYQRVHALTPGSSATLFLSLTVASLSAVDQHGDQWLFPGRHEVWLGSSDKQHAHLLHSFDTVGHSHMVQHNPLNTLTQTRRTEQQTTNTAEE